MLKCYLIGVVCILSVSCSEPTAPPATITPQSEQRPNHAEIARVKALSECNPEYSGLLREHFEKCFVEGMTPDEITEVAGYPGTLLAQSENATVYSWRGNYAGTMTVTFIDGKLYNKAQSGLTNSQFE
jgi:hypothetical protein